MGGKVIKHGMYGTPTYVAWASMMTRCTNPKATKYPSYGGRGIKVCERWRDFINFYADMGVRPSGTTLDRYPDGKGNYEPSNCRWATDTEQARNRSNNKLTANLACQIVEAVHGGASPRVAGEIFGVSRSLVRNIVAGNTWADATEHMRSLVRLRQKGLV